MSKARIRKALALVALVATFGACRQDPTLPEPTPTSTQGLSASQESPESLQRVLVESDT
jgi:hypothetical protein